MLNRREFNGLCVALGSFASPTGAAGLDAAAGGSVTGAGRTAKFRDGTVVRHWAKALRVSERENILKLLNKKRYALAFRSE